MSFGDPIISECKDLVQAMPTFNPFLALALCMWKAGEDAEEIARCLAMAFKVIVDDGVGPGKDQEEYTRLSRGE